jgi:hypothetical protein
MREVRKNVTSQTWDQIFGFLDSQHKSEEQFMVKEVWWQSRKISKGGSGKNFSKVAGTIEKASVTRYLIEQHRAPSCPTLILELGTGMRGQEISQCLPFTSWYSSKNVIYLVLWLPTYRIDHSVKQNPLNILITDQPIIEAILLNSKKERPKIC